MKKYLSILFYLLFTLGTHAQGDSIAFAEMPDGTPLKAPYADFGSQGYSFSLSPDGGLLAVRLFRGARKGSGTWKLCMYDMRMRQMLWERPIGTTGTYLGGKMPDDYSVSFMEVGVIRDKDMMWTRQGLLLSNGNTLRMLDPRTQQEKWKNKLALLMVDDSLDVAVGYKSVTSGKLRALRLSTGEMLWELKASHDTNWGWNGARRVGKSSVLVMNDHLMLIDLLTGEYKTHRARTGYTETGKAFMAGLAMGIAGGLMGGMAGYAAYYIPNVNQFAVSHLKSNIFQRGEYSYVSDRDSLYCFDNRLNVVWSYGFPHGALGASQLFSRGETLYLLNKGYGLKASGFKKPMGVPSLSSFDMMTGERRNTVCYAAQKKAAAGTAVSPDGVFSVFDDSIAYQTLGDTVAHVRPWNVKAYGRIIVVPQDTIYAYREGDAAPTPLFNTEDRCIVITDKSKMFCINRQLKITDDYSADNFYRVYERYGDCCFVGKREKKGYDFWIIRPSGSTVGHVTLDVQAAAMQGGVLFLLCGSKLISIDTHQL
ncbi:MULTISPECIES: hypothetical protein [Prevotellaceae]|uniref:hypothetical protein n=1 Tax=Prevotellaceae TaxID=171552 RepID=UPI0003F8ABC4|nr:hypothetical protein [Prevotella phocaeensis]